MHHQLQFSVLQKYMWQVTPNQKKVLFCTPIKQKRICTTILFFFFIGDSKGEKKNKKQKTKKTKI